ncbi:uncharacterized protein LOC134012335 [Osmerus eperlanus]|uniref:uncharacterized protein LOC134012335 n=1 Tax=Osmerus eperlanus TaxID=29151 RepID=UPI002E1353FB
MSNERLVFDPYGGIYTAVNDSWVPQYSSLNPSQQTVRNLETTMSSIGVIRNCASIEDLKSNAEQMSQHGLKQSQLWSSVANQSSQLRMGHPPHLQQQPTDLERELVSHTWTLLETPGVAGERSQLPNCTPPTPSAGQSVHYRDSFYSGREGQSDSFPVSCQLQMPLPVAKSSSSWFSKLLQAGVDHLPRDTNKPIAWDTFLQRWVNKRALYTEAGSSSPTNAPCPPTMGNDAIQNGVNKYSVQAGNQVQP